MANEMSGKVIAITGASRGIGAAAARIFAKEGAKLALLARSLPEITALAAEINALGGGAEAMAVACDVGDRASVEAALQAVAARFGGLDVMINNAGQIEPIARIADSDPEAWGASIDVNLKGGYYGTHAALGLMRGKGGTIITVSSGAGQRPFEGWSHYSVAKAGASMLTRALHLEEGANGIRALSMSPGTVATQMQSEIRASGINPVSQMRESDHVPAEWPALLLRWMCGAEADAWLGKEVSLRDEAILKELGLKA